MDETTAPGERCTVQYSHFTGESVFLALPPNSSTSSFSLPLCLWLEWAMGTAVDRFLWSALLLLPVFGLSVAIPAGWLPGSYQPNQASALKFLDDYNTTAEEVLFYSVSASWNYNTNLTEHNSQLQVGLLLELPLWHVGWTFLSCWYDFWGPFRLSFLPALAPRHRECMHGQGFLWSWALLDLDITPIHLSPELHAQLPPSAANSACVSLQI